MEPLTIDQHRPTILPLLDTTTWDYYKKLESMLWNAQEVSMNQDRRDWKSLTAGQRAYYRLVLGFFYFADELVLANIDQFMQEIRDPEVRYFYTAQALQECVHSEAYSIQVLSLFEADEIKQMQNLMIENPIINRMAAWIKKYTNPLLRLAVRIAAFVIVESLFFQSHFISIQELKQQNLMPGLAHFNELIARDENQHCLFGIHLLNNKIEHKVTEQEFNELIASALVILDEFIEYMFQQAILAQNSPNHRVCGLAPGLLKIYIRVFADDLSVKLGFRKSFYMVNPFPSSKMMMLNPVTKVNFFEARPSQYQQPADSEFAINEIF